jgi:hypothetical protein
MSYASDKAIEIAKQMIDKGWDEHKVSTCEASNWDQKLHIHFPDVAKELRGMGFGVTVSVNHGVHDWFVIKRDNTIVPKEIRAFVLSADDIDINGGFTIDCWNDEERDGNVLPEEAKRFIRLAKEKGTAYSLKGFMVAQNINGEVGMNDFVFFTKLY